MKFPKPDRGEVLIIVSMLFAALAVAVDNPKLFPIAYWFAIVAYIEKGKRHEH